MAIKAVAEAGKTRTSSSNASKFNRAQPLLQAKASEASSGLSLLMAENSQQKAPADNPHTFSNHKPSPLSNIISSTGIQTQLSIGVPNDSFEREADRVADNVINISTRASTETSAAQSGSSSANAAVQSKTSGDSPAAKSKENTKVQTKINLQKKPVSVENMLSRAPEEGEEEVQAKFILQRGFMDLDGDPAANGSSDVLAKFIQTNRSGKSQASATFESSLNSSKGAGSPLSSNTRSEMESGIGADFSGVRIHTDNNAVQMSQDINSRAFTHGNDIYFNRGQYNPDSSSGKHLIAHELTHTVQQGASVQTQSNISSTSSSTTQPKIQRGWLGDAWDSVSSAASSAVEWAADQLNQALNWAKDQFGDFVQGIPGYKLLSVIMGQDPIKGSPVARNGRNFIEAGLDIIPFGDKFQRKLEETGAMEEAATWLDAEMAKVDISLSSIVNSISAFWDSLSITDLGNIPAVLNRASNIIRRPVSQIITFASNIAGKLLEIVKNAVLSALVNFVKDHTRGYPLLTVILGKDPITDEAVERNGMNLIRGFMMLSEAGEEQLRQMQETGSLQKAADWIDITVARLDLSWETIQNMFSRAWDLVSITSLMDPIGAFQELANIFLEPAGRIIRFVIEVGLKILQLIKDALISRLVTYARTVRGYPLITVILGRDPFSGDTVLRNTENIVHGFMSLMDGGEEQFQEMKSSGAIGRLTARVEAAMGFLNFTWVYIRGLFITAWESFSLSDLAAPFEAFARLLGTFADPLLRLIAFVWEIIKIVIEVLLTMMQFPFALINNIITRAMEAIEDIKRDPIGFLKNLIRAVKQGFIQFFDRIGTHLLNGVTDWLFGQLDDAGISPPADLSFGSILGLVLEILGITVDRIWSKLADRIGQERVDRVRGMIDRLTGIWTFVKDVMQRGVVAIWEYIQERLSNLWDTVLSAIRNWIVTRIVQQVTAKLLSMLDPTGIMAVINGFIAFYNAVQSFIQYLREMLEIVNSFVVGVAEIARGDVSRAANFLEGALAQGLPIAIGFLANQVGLGGLGRRIGEMIENVRGMVNTALDWLVDRAVTTGRAILNRLMGNTNDPAQLEQDDSDEGRKQQAISQVSQAMQGGISRSRLRELLSRLKSRLNLRRAELNSNDDVVIENSPAVTLPGRPIEVQGAPAATSSAGGATPANSTVSVGQFVATASNTLTARGVLGPFMNSPTWPGGLTTQSKRPSNVHAQLSGAIGGDLSLNKRNSTNTRIVGHFGQWESAFRRGVANSWRSGTYDGGHVLGHDFGGDESFENLVPQQGGGLNRGMYARMENFIRQNLTERGSTEMAAVTQPELEVDATMNYGSSPPARTVENTAKIVSQSFTSDVASKVNFVNSVQNSQKNTMVRVPTRIPNSITVNLTLQANVPPHGFDQDRFSANSGGVTSSATENDPIIVPQSGTNTASSTMTGGSASGAGSNGTAPTRQRWNATFNFTQSQRS